MGRYIFLFVIVAVAVLAMALMAFAPQKAEVVPLTIEEQNNRLNQVVFSLEGSPSGDMALFVGSSTIAARLTPGDSVTLMLDGNERASVSLRTYTGTEWDTLHSFTAIEYGAAIRIAVEGSAVQVWMGSQGS